MNHVSDCQPPRTLFRRCGAVWCCRCGELFTLGYAMSYSMFGGVETSKAWVRVSTVRELAATDALEKP